MNEHVRGMRRLSSVPLTHNDTVFSGKTNGEESTNQWLELAGETNFEDEIALYHRLLSFKEDLAALGFNLQQPTTSRHERAASSLPPIATGPDSLDLPFSD